MMLFLYGTLLDRGVLTRVSGDPLLWRRLVPASLAGHRRVVLRGTPYPTLVSAPGERVDGALLEVGAAALRRLAAYEGPPYRLVPVRVQTSHGPRTARAWIAPASVAMRERHWALAA